MRVNMPAGAKLLSNSKPASVYPLIDVTENWAIVTSDNVQKYDMFRSQITEGQKFLKISFWCCIGEGVDVSADKRRKCTLIPGDGVGPELAAQVPVEFDMQTLNMKLRRALDLHANVVHDYAIRNNRKRLTAVHMSLRFYSNSKKPDESSKKPNESLSEVPKQPNESLKMILDYTKNSKRSQLCEVKNVNNLYCYLNVRCLHVGSTSQASNEQMTVDFEEKLKLNELPCSIEKQLETKLEEYQREPWYIAGFQAACAILMPEIRIRDDRLGQEQERFREVLFRRVLRQQIEGIEIEFKKLVYLVQVLNSDANALKEWNQHDPGLNLPITYVKPSYLKIKFTNDVLDIIQEQREEKWYYYLDNSPSVDKKFMPCFFNFKEKLQERNIDFRVAANHTARIYRIISNPFHEESTYLLDKYPKDKRVSIVSKTNEIVRVFTDGLDILKEEEKTN